jgi:hypothetical protein
MSKKIYLFFVTIFLLKNLSAQEFNGFGLFGKGNPFKLNGGLNTSFVYNYSSDPSNGRDPFTSIIGGNLNFTAGGYNIPFNFSYSNAKVTTALPILFNKFSLNPTYKWVNLHLGTTSTIFSQYTLNGHQFDGLGLDLNPGRFKIKLMKGRLLKGTGDYSINNTIPPSYTRKGEGFFAQYDYKGNLFGISIFHAKEDTTSAYNIPVDLLIHPKQNLSTSFTTSFSLFERFKFSAEIAQNLLTQNFNSVLNPVIDEHLLSNFIYINGTTSKQMAKNIQIGYTFFNRIETGLEYEKVDLGYQSLGAYFNQNGFENTSLRLNFSLFNGKINIAPTVGIQNDLTDSISSQNGFRIITSLNTSYNPTSKFSIVGNYSNNKSVTNFRNLDNITLSNNLTPYYLDSLKLVMLNMNANLNFNYQLNAKSDIRQTLSGSYSIQNGSKKEGVYFVNAEASQFHNSNAVFSTTYPKTTFQYNVGINYNLSIQGPNSRTTAYGPFISFGRKFLNKKLTTLFGTSYNSTFVNNTKSRFNVGNLNCNIGYAYKEKHLFKFVGVFQTKATYNSLNGFGKNSTTGLLSVNYNYNF